MNDLYAVILSWAVTLTGYQMPDEPPQVVTVPHAYLVSHACAGRECKVLGWFPPGDKVYLDERLDPRNNLVASSILPHEMVHYLQQQSGKYDRKYSCEKAMDLEREAYGAQGEYLSRYGVYRIVGASMHSARCELTHQADLEAYGDAEQAP